MHDSVTAPRIILHRTCNTCGYSKLDANEMSIEERVKRVMHTCKKCYNTFYCSRKCRKKNDTEHKKFCEQRDNCPELFPVIEKILSDNSSLITAHVEYSKRIGKSALVFDTTSEKPRIVFSPPSLLGTEGLDKFKDRVERHDPSKSQALIFKTSDITVLFVFTSKAYRKAYRNVTITLPPSPENSEKA